MSISLPETVQQTDGFAEENVRNTRAGVQTSTARKSSSVLSISHDWARREWIFHLVQESV